MSGYALFFQPFKDDPRDFIAVDSLTGNLRLLDAAESCSIVLEEQNNKIGIYGKVFFFRTSLVE